LPESSSTIRIPSTSSARADRKQFGIITGVNAPVSVEVTWHLREDSADTLPPQIIAIS
jgi:hypothetical protein